MVCWSPFFVYLGTATNIRVAMSGTAAQILHLGSVLLNQKIILRPQKELNEGARNSVKVWIPSALSRDVNIYTCCP